MRGKIYYPLHLKFFFSFPFLSIGSKQSFPHVIFSLNSPESLLSSQYQSNKIDIEIPEGDHQWVRGREQRKPNKIRLWLKGLLDPENRRERRAKGTTSENQSSELSNFIKGI